MNTTDLVPYEAPSAPAFLLPLGDIAGAQHAIAQYEKLKAAIIVDSDKQIISGRTYLKKSFWRRIAFCFGLSLELVREERILLDDGVTASKLAYRVTYRAVAPNGRSMDGDGMCVYGEKAGPTYTIEHNIRAIAHTRAKNRAISDLVGGGEVSAEEIEPDETTGHVTLAECDRYAREHNIPADAYKRAKTRYRMPAALFAALELYVEKTAEAKHDAAPEPEPTDDLVELPVGARGN